MKLQVKNQILSRISGVLSRNNIPYSIGYYSKTELLCEANGRRFIVDSKMPINLILKSALFNMN